MRRSIADRERFGIKGRKDVYIKRWGVESRNNPVAEYRER